jgi:diketogulonate reductase-like aldo/keto reductase
MLRVVHPVPPIRSTKLPGGETVPVLGQGTWRMGEDKSKRKSEVAALRLGIDLGMTLIDTAEMYANGGAERVVRDAIADRRHVVFVVTKFYPQNATRERMAAACDRSLRRLGIEQIDLYLLHWRATYRSERRSPDSATCSRRRRSATRG